MRMGRCQSGPGGDQAVAEVKLGQFHSPACSRCQRPDLQVCGKPG